MDTITAVIKGIYNNIRLEIRGRDNKERKTIKALPASVELCRCVVTKNTCKYFLFFCDGSTPSFVVSSLPKSRPQ